jgi:hypothetical protein
VINIVASYQQQQETFFQLLYICLRPVDRTLGRRCSSTHAHQCFHRATPMEIMTVTIRVSVQLTVAIICSSLVRPTHTINQRRISPNTSILKCVFLARAWESQPCIPRCVHPLVELEQREEKESGRISRVS